MINNIKKMINCLNKRSDLFKYIFGTNYILKGCHIVEIVINKLNDFNDNVLVVETGRSNVNMINKLKDICGHLLLMFIIIL